MKNILFIFSLLFCSLAFSQTESDISFIKSRVAYIDANYKNFNVVNLNIDNNPKSIYTDDLKKIKLIKEIYPHETEKTIIWNYLENDIPYFILKEYYSYKYPLTDKKFNAADFTTTEECFYLKDGRIIRWMKDKKVLKKYPSNAAGIENNMIEYLTDLIAKFNNRN